MGDTIRRMERDLRGFQRKRCKCIGSDPVVWTIGMPNLGHTMETGRVVEWLKVVGDPVNKGETLAIIESDKVSVEIESPGAGVPSQSGC